MNVIRFTRGSNIREIWGFVFLSCALSWAVTISGNLMGGAGNALTLGAYGATIAGILMSHNGERQTEESTRPGWFLLFWLAGWAALYSIAVLRGYFGETFRTGVATLTFTALPALLPAWILSGAFSGDQGTRAFLRTLVCARSWKWQLVSLFCFGIFLAAVALVAKLRGGELNGPGFPGPMRILIAASINLGAFSLSDGIAQEPGWRGYLLPRLQQTFSPLKASFLVWLTLVLWDLPQDLLGRRAPAPADYVANRVGVVLPLAVIFTWLYNRSGGTIMSAVLFHASIGMFSYLLPRGPETVWLLGVWAAAVVIWDRMWEFHQLGPSISTVSPSAGES